MEFKEKQEKCNQYFNGLYELLKDTHDRRTNKTRDRRPDKYIFPKGTGDEITNVGKPKDSFRYSNKWNFYKNGKGEMLPEVQCYSEDFPHAHTDSLGHGPQGSVLAYSVCFYGEDGRYHVVYGERYNRKTKKWDWVESDPEDAILEFIA